MKRLIVVALLLALIPALDSNGSENGGRSPSSPIAATEARLRFDVTLSRSAAAQIAELGLTLPVNGRLYVIITKDDRREPRYQTGPAGVPFWGKDVRDFAPGDVVSLAAADGEIVGYPLASLEEIPTGEYFVQAFLNVYSRFSRSDGHMLEMHLNSGAGQNIWRAPGNAHSAVKRVNLDPGAGGAIRLEISDVIPPLEAVPPGGSLQQGNPKDRGDLVRFVKIRSDRVSEFWGRDMYIGANVLLPSDYWESPERRYPVIYLQDHFPGRAAPFRYGADGSRGGFTSYWDSSESPKMIVVTFRDANPFYDTSYSVNSANLGPYGDALVRELIPHLEREFRIIAEPWARITAGGSTGGWEALALQIFYPDYFGGAWGWCPDPVDFHYYQIVDIYEDENAYALGNEWVKVERPSSRRFDGNVLTTMRQENYYERAVGPDSRSGGQWAIWEAVFGPVGDNGHPARIWDPLSGAIDRDVAERWRDYDLHQHLRRNWSSIGPKLSGKLHIATGDMDTFYLENAVYRLEEFLTTVDEPPAEAVIEYGRRKPHCWIGLSPSGSGAEMSTAEFIEVVDAYLKDYSGGAW
ncbi:MAG: enterochelin esterase-like enzyme [Gemmatimonadota bacterium]|nr:MAG: enterochelin esterase-like enzyme [Gemmatimonadota bacterium]